MYYVLGIDEGQWGMGFVDVVIIGTRKCQEVPGNGSARSKRVSSDY